ncbi:hypothetical protein HK099_005484, partial [Clydaea vesicula]
MEWSCSYCTFLNKELYLNCQICLQEKVEVTKSTEEISNNITKEQPLISETTIKNNQLLKELNFERQARKRPLDMNKVEALDNANYGEETRKRQKSESERNFSTKGGSINDFNSGNSGANNELKFPKGNVFRSCSTNNPITSEHMTISKLLDKNNLKKALFSSFQYDLPWLLSLLPGRVLDLKKILIIDQNQKPGTDINSSREVAVDYLDEFTKIIFPKRQSGYGCMHIKLQLLWFDKYLRVVIGSGNLVSYDWEKLENVVFVQDFPKIQNDDKVPDTDFKKQLLNLLKIFSVDEKILKDLESFNYSLASGKLVFSVPGTYKAESPNFKEFGLTRLSTVVKDILNIKFDGEHSLIYMTSSLGSLTSSWINDLYLVSKGEQPGKTANEKFNDNVKVLFPTKDYVTNSFLGLILRTKNGKVSQRISNYELGIIFENSVNSPVFNLPFEEETGLNKDPWTISF